MASSRPAGASKVLASGLALSLVASVTLRAEATHRHRGTPTIDGVESDGEWDGALVGLFPLRLPQKLGGRESLVPFYAMNDDEFVYVAARIDYGKSPRYPYWLSLHVESWGEATSCLGGDLVDAFTTWSFDDLVNVRDWFIADCDNLYPDYAASATSDTVGAWTIADGSTFFEMAQPLASGDAPYDLDSPPPGIVFLNWTAGGGNDFSSDWGWPAQSIVRMFLSSSDTLLYADFEGGDFAEWSDTAP